MPMEKDQDYICPVSAYIYVHGSLDMLYACENT